MEPLKDFTLITYSRAGPDAPQVCAAVEAQSAEGTQLVITVWLLLKVFLGGAIIYYNQ